MERLRSHLGIDRWVVAGGSWGVTLALVYAQRHPERVLGMVLAAVTSGRWRETQWITRDMGRVFPRQWDRFVELLPGAERGGDLAAAYARLLASPDQAVREEAARRWCEWEDTHMSLAPGYEPHLSVRELSWQMVFARLVTHYWGHGCFLADNEVLANMARIAHIPATLIHGLHGVLEAPQARGPQVGQEGVEVLQPFGVHHVQPALALAPHPDQASAGQGVQVLRHGLLADVEVRADLAH